MPFNPFHYNPEVFQKLSFLGELLDYVYEDANKSYQKGFLFKVTYDDYFKIKSLLKGEEKENPIVTDDKVYVLPKCTIPSFKIKEYLKSVGAKQVSDISEANKIIGHDNIEAVNKHQMSALIKSYDRYLTNQSINVSYKKTDDIDAIKNLIAYQLPVLKDKPTNCIIDISFYKFFGYRCVCNDNIYLVTPTCAEILYYKMANKIPIVSEQSVFDAINKPLIIDKEVYNTLVTMFESGDVSNHTTAIEIICNSDIKQSTYYLWRLAKSFFEKMEMFRRNKNYRLFKERFKLDLMAVYSNKAMLSILQKDKLLTKEIYQELITEIFKLYQHTYKTELFDITLVPSKLYEEYADKENVYFIPAEVKISDSN